MTSQVIVFPFDSFGGEGTAAGAKLLGDAVREMIDDTLQESKPVRLSRIVNRIHVKEVAFDEMKALANWRELGAKALKETLRKHDFTLWLGGNHLSCLPVYEAMKKNELIIQLDAHLDCYDLHDTQTSLSNGNFLKQVESKQFINIGHRDLILKDAGLFECCIPAIDYRLRTDDAMATLAKRIEAADSVWLDLDADAFDPAICPGVLNPKPLGLSGFDFIRIVQAIPHEKLRGVSVSEFCPAADSKDMSLELLGWLIEWLLLHVHENRPNRD